MSKSSHRPYSVDKFLQTDDLYPLEYADEQFEEELECAHYFSKDPNNQLLELVLIDFKDAKFCEKLTKNMKLHKITGPTPIQAFAIPQLLENHKQNFRISASPGSGKTLVYVLPIIDYIIRQKLALKYSLRKDAHLPPSRKAGHPFAVVILPTPATTIQLKSVLNSLRGAVGNFSICTLLKNSEDDESTKKEKENCDIVIGTLGMVTNYFFCEEVHQAPTFKTSQLKFVVVDDCSANIRNEAARLFKRCRTDQCSLIVVDSETFNAPGELETLLTKQSIELVIRTPQLPKNIRHEFWEMECWAKDNELVKIIENHNAEGNILVYVNDTQDALRLFERLNLRFASELLIDCLGAKEVIGEGRRLRVIKHLVSGLIDVLIVNGEHPIRGLNFQKVSYVVHFDLPKNLTDYQRQSGRCGFSNRFGTITNFVTPDDRDPDIISYCREICDSTNAVFPRCWKQFNKSI